MNRSRRGRHAADEEVPTLSPELKRDLSRLLGEALINAYRAENTADKNEEGMRPQEDALPLKQEDE
jgi:hypothetical protein